MNNEIAKKSNNNFDVQKEDVASKNTIEKFAAQKTNSSINSDLKNMQNPIYSNKVDNIKKYCEEYSKNPDLIEMHIDFCDSLIEHGYDLREAMNKTDKVFEILRQKDTYQ